ncbi:hypothetical protein C8Q75DRAFT_272446 [Abortiporus biennis]|nr:hypothetical protein C8Q75DRAFT_272446 [Abortiporus biennis]
MSSDTSPSAPHLVSVDIAAKTTANDDNHASPSSRKSPPPPRLKFDTLNRPFFSTTSTNISSNTSSNESTAFVFTSSRTLRALHDSSIPSVASIFSSSSASPVTTPGSPGVSPDSNNSKAGKSRPSLTRSQLAKHSVGALDTRCMVGPNMRAAGFVPLANSSLAQAYNPYSSHPESPPTPTSSGAGAGIPTPNEPPPFPPIVFVSPSMVATTSIWDYQLGMGLGITGKERSQSAADLSLPTPSPDFEPMPESIYATLSSSQSTSFTSSTSSIFSTSSKSTAKSSSTSISSIPSIGSQITDVDSKAKRMSYMSSPSRVDGYPFPQTPPRSRTHSNAPSTKSDSTTTSAYHTANENEPSSTASLVKSNTALSASSNISSSSHRTSSVTTTGQTRRKRISTKLPPDYAPPSFITARPRRPVAPDAQLSLTELCVASSRAWVTDPDCLGPMPAPSPGTSSSSSTSTVSLTSGDGKKKSRGRSTSVSGIGEGTHGRGRTRDRGKRREVEVLKNNATTRVPKKIAEEVVVEGCAPSSSAEVRLNKEITHKPNVPDNLDEWDPVKEHVVEKGKHRAHTKRDSIDSLEDKEKVKAQDPDSRQSSTNSRHSMGKGYAYSSFTFPPATTSGDGKAGAHHLGDHERTPSREEEVPPSPKEHREHHHHRDKERSQRSKELGALVQAHRDRDREKARQSVKEHREDPEILRKEEYTIEHAAEIKDVVDELWDKSLKVSVCHMTSSRDNTDFWPQKRMGRGRGAAHISGGKPRRPAIASSYAASDAETMVDLDGRH